MKRFEIMEKFYLSKALLAGGGAPLTGLLCFLIRM